MDTAPLKRLIAAALLEQHGVFMVTAQTNHPQLEIPEPLRKAPYVNLLFGVDLPRPIHDLHIDLDRISGTLSFQAAPFFCVVPWDAVVGFADAGGRPIVAFAAGMTADNTTVTKREPKGLRLIKGGGTSAVPAVNVGGCPGGVDTVEPA